MSVRGMGFMNHETDDAKQLDDLLLRWEETYENGTELSPEELCQDQTQWIPEVSRRIEALKSIDWVKDFASGGTPQDATSSWESSDLSLPYPGGPDHDRLQLEIPSKPLAGRYRFERFVAAGGFGQVWQAFDTELQRPVAIKWPHGASLNRHGAIEDFVTEARRVAALKHSGIVPVYDVIRQEDAAGERPSCYLISEFVDGGSLLSRIGETESHQAIDWIAQIAEALHYAHQAGFIHCDIKPSNILVDHQNQARLTDFGIARQVQDQSEPPSAGTLAYMAPETLLGKGVTSSSDLFSLGIVLVELLTGHRPFDRQIPSELETLERDTVAHQWDRNVLVTQPDLGQVPTSLRSICERCLAHDPGERWENGRQLADELYEARDHTRSMSHAESDKRLARWRVGLGISLCFLMGTGVVATQMKWRVRGADRPPKIANKDSHTEDWPPQPGFALKARQLDRRGSHRFNRGEYEAAIEDFNQAIEKESTDASFYEHRSLAFAMLKRYEEAIADLEKALVLTPDDTMQYRSLLALNFVGIAKRHADRREFAAGVVNMNQAIEHLPIADHYHRRASMHYNQRHFQRAIADWNKAIGLAPANDVYRGHRSTAIEAVLQSEQAELNRRKPTRQDAGQAEVIGDFENSLGMNMKRIPAGIFIMGSDGETTSHSNALKPWVRWKSSIEDERPIHQVEISKSFYLAATEVTVAQFKKFVDDTQYRTDAEKSQGGAIGFNTSVGKVMRSREHTWKTPQFDQDDHHPVVYVSHQDAQAFCDWLSRKEQRRYRLPSEAQWEYACRAGTTSEFHFGDDHSQIWQHANVRDSSLIRQFNLKLRPGEQAPGNDGYPNTAPVASYRPSPFGIFDMHGNVWEWCEDAYDSEFYANSARQDPRSSSDTDPSRCVRGGGWQAVAVTCRSAYRSRNPADYQNASIGFRVLAEIP